MKLDENKLATVKRILDKFLTENENEEVVDQVIRYIMNPQMDFTSKYANPVTAHGLGYLADEPMAQRVIDLKNKKLYRDGVVDKKNAINDPNAVIVAHVYSDYKEYVLNSENKYEKVNQKVCIPIVCTDKKTKSYIVNFSTGDFISWLGNLKSIVTKDEDGHFSNQMSFWVEPYELVGHKNLTIRKNVRDVLIEMGLYNTHYSKASAKTSSKKNFSTKKYSGKSNRKYKNNEKPKPQNQSETKDFKKDDVPKKKEVEPSKTNSSNFDSLESFIPPEEEQNYDFSQELNDVSNAKPKNQNESSNKKTSNSNSAENKNGSTDLQENQNSDDNNQNLLPSQIGKAENPKKEEAKENDTHVESTLRTIDSNEIKF